MREYWTILDDITVNLFLLSWAGSFAEKQEKKSTADGGVAHELGKQGREISTKRIQKMCFEN